MTKREQYDVLGRTPPHRIPRCTTCHLVLPCRNDGSMGPCDARDVSHDSHAQVCDLLRAIFAEPANDTDVPERDDSERRERLRLARAASNSVRQARCKAGHEQTPGNVYEGLRNGKLRVWCRVCQVEQYRRKRDEKRKMAMGGSSGELLPDNGGVPGGVR